MGIYLFRKKRQFLFLQYPFVRNVRFTVLAIWIFGILDIYCLFFFRYFQITILAIWTFGYFSVIFLVRMASQITICQIAILPFGMEMDIPACFARWKKVDMVIPELPERRHLSYWDSAASWVHPA